MKLDVSREAKADLQDIYGYSTKQWGRDRARDYIFGIREHFRALISERLSGTSAEDVSTGLRRLTSGSHVIWFRIEGDVLRVIRVLHASRDAGQWVR